MTYTETRSKRALAIDRALQARQVHRSFNQPYKQAPNRSDVQDYDTAMKDPPKPKPEPVHRGSLDEYQPSPNEMTKLRIIFHRESLLMQHHDLLVTKNVARNKADVEKWKTNPKASDIRGIDTQPKTLIPKRLDFATKYVGSPTIIQKKFRWKSKRGFYAAGEMVGRGRYRPKPESAGTIAVDISKPERQHPRTLAHELGHAFDRNIAGKKARGQRPPTVGFIPTGSRLGDSSEADKEVFGEVTKVTETHEPFEKKHAPISFLFYRGRTEERFANWFSAMVTDRSLVKIKSPKYYKQFKKDYPDFAKGMRKSDIGITKKYMGGVLI